MSKIQHYATNAFEDARVTIIAPEVTYENVKVEYCISSGYVKVETTDGKTVITHISNVVIELQ